jgi:hypothetical protein
VQVLTESGTQTTQDQVTQTDREEMPRRKSTLKNRVSFQPDPTIFLIKNRKDNLEEDLSLLEDKQEDPGDPSG